MDGASLQFELVEVSSYSGAPLIAAQTYTVGINYNARGESIKYTYPDGSIVDRTYHATGNLHQVKLAGTTLDTRTYDAGGRMATSTYQNFRSICDHDLEERNDLDLEERKDFELVFPLAPVLRGEGSGVRGKLIEVLTGVNATVNGYGFNAVDTTYDFEDRLTQWKRANGAQNQSWSLTAVGDWQSQTVNGTATSRTHGPTHELTAIGASSLAYDAKGNLTQDTSRSPTQNYVWDYDNKMRSADIDGNGSADVSFEYDALGRRVARTQGANAVVYFQVDQQTICDYPRGGAAASPTYRYYWGSYIDELIARKATGTGGAVLFAHRNQQYSIYAYSNSSGAVVERIAYTAYGQPTFMNAAGTVQSTSPNSIRYSYTGREWDASLQLHHFRARWMGPVTGRFLGRDPIGYRDSPSIYSFVLNNPICNLDPTGMECDSTNSLMPPATPTKCALAWSMMIAYANLISTWSFDSTLVNHYADGAGAPINLPWEAFDRTGKERDSALEGALLLASVSAGKRAFFENLPCNQRKHIVTETYDHKTHSTTSRMINGYTLTAYIEVTAVKKCEGCDRWCYWDILGILNARDEISFKPGAFFGFPPFCAADSLILDCGFGAPFFVSAPTENRKMTIAAPCSGKQQIPTKFP